jgi:hypothetical protein
MNRLSISAAIVAATLGLAISPAWAQDSSLSTAGSLDRFGPIGGPQLQLNASTEDESGSIALELPTGPTQSTRFALILSTPVREGADDARPADLDGLANGTKLTLRVGRFLLHPFSGDPPALARSIAAEAREECRRKRRLEEKSEDEIAGCATEPVSNMVGIYQAGRAREYEALLEPRPPRDFGFELSVGVNDFDFVDPATLAEDNERHVQWSVSGHFTQYFIRSRSAISVSASYERAWEAADEATFCPPNPTNVVIQCTTAAGGPPELNESLLLSLGLRHQFGGRGLFRGLAIAPVVTYDVLDDVVGVDVPVYILPDSDGGLTGGVRFGYRSDREDKFSVGIFIGAAFSLFQ